MENLTAKIEKTNELNAYDISKFFISKIRINLCWLMYTKVQNLVYYSYVSYLVLNKVALFPSTAITTWSFGALIEYESQHDIQSILLGSPAIDYDLESIPEATRVFLDNIWGRYGGYTASKLYKLVSDGLPLLSAKDGWIDDDTILNEYTVQSNYTVESKVDVSRRIDKEMKKKKASIYRKIDKECEGMALMLSNNKFFPFVEKTFMHTMENVIYLLKNNRITITKEGKIADILRDELPTEEVLVIIERCMERCGVPKIEIISILEKQEAIKLLLKGIISIQATCNRKYRR